ncbi:MAG TPA: carbon-nitrogen hydrolase family protein [Hyphomicrobiaceae bacterium]|nr:carbon-nitrogen hydrolase family protein [Hyphomicrobiaceae bacterium]
MAPRDKLAVAAAQYPIEQPATLAAWRDKIARWVGDGADTGAELLVFPEYAAIEQAACFGGAVASDLSATLEKVAELAGERVAFHAELARRHRVHILAGSGPLKTSGGRFVNAAQLVAPSGCIGEQQKIVLTPFERDWGISAGAALRVFETALGKLAVAICYDCEFPLLVRALAEAGAEAVLVPSCTERLSGYNRVRTSARARALENTIATVVSATVGDAPWSPAIDRNAGAAGVYVPAEQGVADDGVLAAGALSRAQWVAATVDLAALRRLRTSGEMRNFADWSAQPGAVPLAHHVEVVSLI